jgi:CRP/FNR family transcriptional regulator, anaerobic regulatory protein
MAVEPDIVKKYFPFIGSRLQQVIAQDGVLMDFESNTEILNEGQSVKMIPLVLDGLIRVFIRNEDKELLLYHIEPSQSCVMSFLAGIRNKPSRIFAVTEQSTRAILLPAQKVAMWTAQFPEINHLFYDLYDVRYSELIDTLNQLIFQRLDSRLLDYLKEKSRLQAGPLLNLRHRQIALDLGTSREVVTRVLKKLEREGKIIQHGNGIRLI